MSARFSMILNISLIVLIMFKQGLAAIKRQKLTYNLAMSGAYTNVGQINVLIRPSLSSCCVECFMNTGCKAVGYEEKDNLCSLHDLTFLEGLGASTSSYKMDYYLPSCPSTNAEYLYDITSESCLSSRRDRMTWKEAVRSCSKDGAHVMFMRTQGEYDFLAGQLKLEYLTGKKFWVGGSKTENDTFTWSSGEIIDESSGGKYWLAGKPNFSSVNKDCIRIRSNPDLTSSYTNDYGMENKNCTEIHQFYCQLDN